MLAAAVDVQVLQGGEVQARPELFHAHFGLVVVAAGAGGDVLAGEDCLAGFFQNCLHVFAVGLDSELQVSLDLLLLFV